MTRIEAWDAVAVSYDRVRPSYPERLLEDLCVGARLNPGSRLLEIGAGTGKATLPLAQRGYAIHCLEPGPNLAEILLQKCAGYPEVSVELTTFEHWSAPAQGSFDLIYAAQAFHWLDPDSRYQKCHQALKADGRLALFWYHPVPDASVQDEIDAMLRRHAPEVFPEVGARDERWEQDIIASGLFGEPEVHHYTEDRPTKADTYLQALTTQSAFGLLGEELKTRLRANARALLDRYGGQVTVRMEYTLCLSPRL